MEKLRGECVIPNILYSVGKEEMTTDRKVKKVISPYVTVGRGADKNFEKKTKSLRLYARGNIGEESVLRTWCLIFSDHIMRLIEESTEEKTHRRLT